MGLIQIHSGLNHCSQKRFDGHKSKQSICEHSPIRKIVLREVWIYYVHPFLFEQCLVRSRCCLEMSQRFLCVSAVVLLLCFPNASHGLQQVAILRWFYQKDQQKTWRKQWQNGINPNSSSLPFSYPPERCHYPIYPPKWKSGAFQD